MKKIQVEIPIKTISEANCSEHWSKKSKRHKRQQFFIRIALNKYVKELKLPCTVILTRISPRLLDDDNLISAFKWIRDEISELIIPEKSCSYITKIGKIRRIKGRADSDYRISWKYFQEKGSIAHIRVEIQFEN